MMTYIYIKIHNTTGLKYFGKTQQADVHKYKGSGKYWLKHIRKHGYDVTTGIVFSSDKESELITFCLRFSKEVNIVESDDWANLREENGIDGNPVGITFSEEHRKKFSQKLIGNTRNKGRIPNAETKKKMSQSQQGNKNRLGKTLSEAHKRAISESNKRRARMEL